MKEDQNIIFDDWRTGNTYDVSVYSGIGKRESQQDCAYVAANDSSVFAVLCDGMGGMNGGRIASHTAVEAFLEHYQYKSAEPDWMKQAVLHIDDYIYQIRDEDGKFLRAGTTLVAVTLNRDELKWVSVGDSRLYVYRQGELIQATTDHSYFAKIRSQHEDGELSDEEYLNKRREGDGLLSFVGMGGIRMLDLNETPVKLLAGDMILICSDGLWKTVHEKELLKILSDEGSVEEAAREINHTIELLDRKDQDNFTYILIRVMED
uniref:PP2C family protein-serine/threonine phosphatase n=1 Tax=Eubacterium cellulosolvens TaxID=29322 RepID=UPI00048147D9|nr:protein phosphatase 2C domain-containing protein [[Eubacterium] cellulosolvens]